MSPGVRGTDSAAVQHVTRGTYQREIVADSGLTLTPGTEFEVNELGDNVVASTADKDELFSWVRGFLFVYDTTNHVVYEWAVVRQLSTDGLPDFNSSSAVEALHKDKKILARGMLLCPDPDSGGPVKPIKFEFYNVALRYGEELRLVIRPIQSSGGASGRVDGLVEWRQVGQ